MPLKLGQLLIEEKLITPQQLEEALEFHVVYGLKLGSILVEMGYITAEQLAKLLSKKLGVARATTKDVLSAPKDLLSRFTPDLAAKYRFIPFKIDQNRLNVAMSDPTDFKSIQELEFLSGYVIKTFIAPDILIAKALSKFYRVSTAEIRYQALRRKDKRNRTENEPANTVTFQVKSAEGELINIAVPTEFEGFESYLGRDYVQNYLAGTPNSAKEGLIAKYSIDQLSIDFAKADSREEIADVFIRYIGQEFEVGAIFLIYGDEAVGWRGIANGRRMMNFELFNWSLKKPSVLQKVMQKKEYILGNLDNNTSNQQINFLLETKSTTPMFTIPVVMHESIVAIIMVSANRADFRSKMADIEKLVQKMSLALEKQIINLKILMT